MKNKGYVIFTKNGKQYKVSDKRFLKRGKYHFYRIEKGYCRTTITITITDDNIEEIRFVNCDFSELEKSLSIWLNTEHSNETKIFLDHVKFGARDVALKTKQKSYIQARHITCDGYLTIRGRKDSVISLSDLYNVALDVAVGQGKLNINNYIVDINNHTVDKDTPINFAANSIQMKNTDIKVMSDISISCARLEHENVSLMSDSMTICNLFKSSELGTGNVYTIDDEKMDKLFQINQLVSVLKGMEDSRNDEIQAKKKLAVRKASSAHAQEIKQLEHRIKYLKRIKHVVGKYTEEGLQKEPIHSYTKKNTK